MDNQQSDRYKYLELATRIAEMLSIKTGSLAEKTDSIIESAKKLQEFAESERK